MNPAAARSAQSLAISSTSSSVGDRSVPSYLGHPARESRTVASARRSAGEVPPLMRAAWGGATGSASGERLTYRRNLINSARCARLTPVLY